MASDYFTILGLLHLISHPLHVRDQILRLCGKNVEPGFNFSLVRFELRVHRKTKFHPNKLLANFLLLINVHQGHLISMNIEELCAYIVEHRSDKVTTDSNELCLKDVSVYAFFHCLVVNGTEEEAVVERYFFLQLPMLQEV